ncbi:protein NYNRIN-like [Hyperolius riggenbachi]|uniref:protein NYNRIN-like n=1 Tax=Hyperolius riggenbachi TaxID=752182 RepID=UPI0035A2E104
MIDDYYEEVGRVKDTPLDHADLTVFIDGSRYYSEGQPVTGYSVVTKDDVLFQGKLPSSCSAQVAELMALMQACIIGKGQRLNVYLDSRYGYGICHDFGQLWRMRGFLTTNGKPIKHAELIKRVLESLWGPTEVAVIKCEAHTKGTDEISLGNNKADMAAKDAALHGTMITEIYVVSPPQGEGEYMDLTVLKNLQTQTEKQTRQKWEEQGCSEIDGLWSHADGRYCAPPTLYHYLVEVSHGPSHLAKDAIISLITKYWVAPGVSTVAERFCQTCETCQKHNPGKLVKTPTKHLPRPLYPFQRLQIDYIQLPKCQQFQYVLVCVDIFSGWVEAWPVAQATASATAKKLLQEIVCRYGIFETLESDRGTHFTGQVMTEVLEGLQVEQRFHTPYHPQASDPESDTGSHSLKPGDWVVVKRFQRKGLENRFDGPYQVLLTTSTSVKLEGKIPWIHASHCKKIRKSD